jgi:hypothetical protein
MQKEAIQVQTKDCRQQQVLPLPKRMLALCHLLYIKDFKGKVINVIVFFVDKFNCVSNRIAASSRINIDVVDFAVREKRANKISHCISPLESYR